MAVARSHVFVTGLVQGVFFRATCVAQARRFGVTGWIRNVDDGRVEAVFEGEEAAIAQMVEWCRRGPEGAEVTAVDEQPEPPEGEPSFAVRATTTCR